MLPITKYSITEIISSVTMILNKILFNKYLELTINLSNNQE